MQPRHRLQHFVQIARAHGLDIPGGDHRRHGGGARDWLQGAGGDGDHFFIHHQEVVIAIHRLGRQGKGKQ